MALSKKALQQKREKKKTSGWQKNQISFHPSKLITITGQFMNVGCELDYGKQALEKWL
jgi:hypothetical protein